MRILLPETRPTKIRREQSRRHRRRRLLLLLGLGGAVVALYVFPGARPPGDLYSDVDGRVLQSMLEARADYPLTRIDVGGRIWSYRRVGHAAEAIVFLHGFGGASDVWWQQLGALGDHYSILATDYAPVRTLEQTAAGIRAALDAEGIERAHFVGTSLGGYVAQFFAIQYPERVSSVVMANTFPPGPWLRKQTRGRGTLAPVLPTWMLRASFRSSIRRQVFPASGNSTLVRDYLLEQSHTMTRSDFLTRIRLLRQRFQPSDLGNGQIPVLILEADNDPLVPPIAREALRTTYPHARVESLSDVGHFPYLNRPAQYTRTLEAFFASLRPPPEPSVEADSTLAGDSRSAADTGSVSHSG